MPKEKMTETLSFGGLPFSPAIENCAFDEVVCKKPGYVIEIAQLIAQTAGREFRIHRGSGTDWGAFNGTIWSGILGDVESGRTDLTVPLYILTKERGQGFDHTQAIDVDLAKFVFKRKGSSAVIVKWWRLFDMWSWLCIALVAVSCIAIQYTQPRHPQYLQYLRRFVLLGSSLFAWLLFFCGGILSSGFLSHIIVPQSSAPFNTMAGALLALHKGTIKLALYSWKAAIAKPFRHVIQEQDVYIIGDIRQLFQKVRDSTTPNYFTYLMADELYGDLLLDQPDLRLEYLQDESAMTHLVIFMAKNAKIRALRGQITEVITRLNMFGHLIAVKRRCLMHLHMDHQGPSHSDWYSLPLPNFVSMFYFWLMGSGIGFVIFILEIIYGSVLSRLIYPSAEIAITIYYLA